MPIHSTYQHAEMPPWYMSDQKSLAEASKALLGYNEKNSTFKEYEPYKGKRVEPFTDDTNKSFDLARQTGAHAPYFQRYQQFQDQGNQDFPEHAQRYMNPHQEHVINNLIKNSKQTWDEIYEPSIAKAFIHYGGHGGSEQKALFARMAAQHDQNLKQQIDESNRAAYNTAGNLFEAKQKRALQSAEHSPVAAAAHQAGNIADVATLGTIGEQQRGLLQADRDIEYQNFMRQKAFPQEQLSHHAAIMNGLTAPQSIYQATQNPGAPQLDSIGRLGALAGQLGMGAMAYGQRRAGGHIQHYMDGGQVNEQVPPWLMDLEERFNRLRQPNPNNVNPQQLMAAQQHADNHWAQHGPQMMQGAGQMGMHDENKKKGGIAGHPFTQTSFTKKPKVGQKNTLPKAMTGGAIEGYMR